MATKILHGINLDEFRFRQAKDALAQAIFYARAQAYQLEAPHWLGITHELREYYRGLAEVTLRLEPPATVSAPVIPPVLESQPALPVVVLSLRRNFATCLRGVVKSPVIGAISEALK